MRKQTTNGVGQLALTFSFSELKDETQETEVDASAASGMASAPGSKPERKRKWNSLIDKVYALPNLEKAWKRVAENKGAAGIDGITVKMYARDVATRLAELSQDLRNKTYRPKPVRRVLIPKPGGTGERPLGIPTIRDRIVQQAIKQVLEPIFEPKFSKRSHGFRPGLGSATALEVVDKAIQYGYSHVVDADIASFFDTVDHDKLLTALNEEVADGSLLKLIRFILKAGVVMPQAAEAEPTELGTPQGGPLSPLLANVYLHAFDMAMQKTKYGLVRYADDFVLFAKSEEEAQEALKLARQVLEGELGLTLHPEKTRVVSVDEGFEFLGFHYFRDPKSHARCKEVRLKSVARFREQVRKHTRRLHAHKLVKRKHITLNRLRRNKRVKTMIDKVNDYLRGWHWYFKAVRGRYESPFETFDGFTRRRIRAAIVGRVGNGWWNATMTNAFLQKLGYVGVQDLDARYRAGKLDAPVRKD